jgi:hypothetical protein
MNVNRPQNSSFEAANDNNPKMAGRVFVGVDQIASFLQITRRQAYYAISSGRMPVYRLGGSQIHARETVLLRYIEDQERRNSYQSPALLMQLKRQLDDIDGVARLIDRAFGEAANDKSPPVQQLRLRVIQLRTEIMEDLHRYGGVGSAHG